VVYRLHAELRFSLSTVRSSAQAQIGSAGTVQTTLARLPSLIVDRSSDTPASIQSTYALIAAMGTPQANSVVHWHQCLENDATGPCVLTAVKRW